MRKITKAIVGVFFVAFLVVPVLVPAIAIALGPATTINNSATRQLTQSRHARANGHVGGNNRGASNNLMIRINGWRDLPLNNRFHQSSTTTLRPGTSGRANLTGCWFAAHHWQGEIRPTIVGNRVTGTVAMTLNPR
ncbi:MAG: hypothetical protein FWC86_06290 [Coriobacteriia bacterium]|nr:hypothetical protein [Coriobacteriia bacterium]